MKPQYLIFLLMLLFGYSQAVAAFSGQAEPTEKIVIVTDRSLYIAGERIRFSAVLTHQGNSLQSEENSILYAELITPEGIKICGGKFPIHESISDGCLPVPSDLITGVYYFRAYTRFMRNYGPAGYTYLPVKIVNPSRNDIQTGSSTFSLTDSIHETWLSASLLHITTDKDKYERSDTIRMTVAGGKEALKGITGMSFSVVPDKSFSGKLYQLPDSQSMKDNEGIYPETEGISLTGKLIGADDGKPQAGALVNLSIIGKGRDFMASRTDSSGRFYFTLPSYSGKRDLFICAARLPGKETRILVDNDFCTQPVHLPAFIFDLDESERAAAYNMAVNHLVLAAYHPDTADESVQPFTGEKPFYGTPSATLYLDQYVQLPTLEEYFNELPMTVRIRKRKGERYFKVYGLQSELEVYEPLVLIDNVAVDDPEKILKVQPEKISRIEIVNEAYIKGSQTFGGIISIISKKGDFAGVDLPASGIFLNYQFLDTNQPCEGPVDSGHYLPDARNTLFWMPHVPADQIGDTTITLTAADSPGTYAAVFSYFYASGEVRSQKVTFEVK